MADSRHLRSNLKFVSLRCTWIDVMAGSANHVSGPGERAPKQLRTDSSKAFNRSEASELERTVVEQGQKNK